MDRLPDGLKAAYEAARSQGAMSTLSGKALYKYPNENVDEGEGLEDGDAPVSIRDKVGRLLSRYYHLKIVNEQMDALKVDIKDYMETHHLERIDSPHGRVELRDWRKPGFDETRLSPELLSDYRRALRMASVASPSYTLRRCPETGVKAQSIVELMILAEKLGVQMDAMILLGF